MRDTLSRPAAALQSPTPADCRHSKAAFHCEFVPIGKQTDLSDAAKRLHAGLVSMVRQGLRWTQTELAELLGWKARQKVWRAASELVAAGLLRVKRLGLGRPNEYLLVPTTDVSVEDIAAKAPRTRGSRAGHQEDRIRNTPRARVPFYPKNEAEEREKYRPKAEGPRPSPAPLDPKRARTACLVCPGALHAPDACPATTPAAPVAPVGGPCAYCHVEHGPPQCTAWMFGGRR